MSRHPVLIFGTIAVSVALASALAGCSGASSPTDTSTPGGSSSSSSHSGSGAKKVDYDKTPCALIGEAKVQTIVGYSLAGEASIPSSTVAECIYKPVDSSNPVVSFGFTTYPLTILKGSNTAPYIVIAGDRTFCAANTSAPGSELAATTTPGTFFIDAKTCGEAFSIAQKVLPEVG